MSTLLEAVQDGFPMWLRGKWSGAYWLDIQTMQLKTWDQSDRMHPKIVLASHSLTDEDILADDWRIMPLGG